MGISKVEELKESLLISIGDYERCPTKHVFEIVIAVHINALISAAIEQERERIRKAADEWASISPWERRSIYNDSNDKLRIVVDSILTPKEAL